VTVSFLPCLVDGVVAADGRVALRADGDAIACGEGLFESLPVLGGAPKFLGRHLRRLAEGAAFLRLDAPDAATVRRDVARLAAAVGAVDFSLRLTLLRDGAVSRRLCVAAPLPADVEAPVRLGWVAPPFDGPRTLGRWKTLNYLAARLAHRDGVARGFDEVLFRDVDGAALEGTRSNLFVIEDGRLATPPTTAPVLPGVTREVILEVARAAGVPVAEERLDADRVFGADEAFISASVRGLRPASSIEGRPFRAVEGPVVRRLRDAYRAAFRASDGE